MDRFLIGMLVAAFVIALITWGLAHFVSHRRWVSYLPAGLMLVLGLHQVAVARAVGGFEALARGLLAVLILSGAIGGAIAVVSLDVCRRRARRHSSR